MSRLIHPSIQCKADEIGATEYEMPDGTIVLAYNREDAVEFHSTHQREMKEPEPELPL